MVMFVAVKFVVTCCFFVLSFCLSAQESDARLWLYAKLEKKFGKKLETSLLVQNRFEDNFMSYSQFNLNPEITYKINRSFRLVGGLVQGFSKKKEGYFLPYHQFYAGGQFRYQLGVFKLVYRHLVQAQSTAGYNREKAEILRWYDRNKLTVRYSLTRRFEPYFAGEFNLCLFDPSRQLGDISRYRTFIGVTSQLRKNLDLDTYFMYQQRLAGEAAGSRQFVYGVTIVYFLD